MRARNELHAAGWIRTSDLSIKSREPSINGPRTDKETTEGKCSTGLSYVCMRRGDRNRTCAIEVPNFALYS